MLADTNYTVRIAVDENRLPGLQRYALSIGLTLTIEPPEIVEDCLAANGVVQAEPAPAPAAQATLDLEQGPPQAPRPDNVVHMAGHRPQPPTQKGKDRVRDFLGRDNERRAKVLNYLRMIRHGHTAEEVQAAIGGRITPVNSMLNSLYNEKVIHRQREDDGAVRYYYLDPASQDQGPDEPPPPLNRTG